MVRIQDDLYEYGNVYEGGDLIMPIYEDLEIQIK